MRIGDEEYTTCPRRPVKDHPLEFGYWMRLYRFYRRGFLPEDGSVMEQCNVTLQVFDIMERVYGDIDEYRQAEADKKRGGDKTRPRGGRLKG